MFQYNDALSCISTQSQSATVVLADDKECRAEQLRVRESAGNLLTYVSAYVCVEVAK